MRSRRSDIICVCRLSVCLSVCLPHYVPCLCRLHDVLTNLKRKYEKQEKQYRDDNQQLTSDFKHQLDQFRDVQKKAQSVYHTLGY